MVVGAPYLSGYVLPRLIATLAYLLESAYGMRLRIRLFTS